jgi:pyruvate,orthophosphate dikinase
MTAKLAVFGPNRPTGEVSRELFGNKAATLIEMSGLGVPVPPGFALSVDVSEEYFANGERLPDDLPELLNEGIAGLEEATGRVFGSPRRPLLVSVRSGAAISMPGIMETILNVGLNRDAVQGLLYYTGNPRFAWDCYRRLLAQFGDVVYGHEPARYRALLREAMDREGVPDEAELDTTSLRDLASQYERLLADAGTPFPANVPAQLLACTEAVLRSWRSPRAEAFRRHRLAEDARGTAITVQAMVFGNLDAASGAGVAFTRNPWNGEPELTLDFRFGAQGEEVVSGEQTGLDQERFSRVLPWQSASLQGIGGLLEQHYRDMQDIEFTIQAGELFILQSRDGKRTPLAALRIAVDLVGQGVIGESEAGQRLADIDLDTIRIRRVATAAEPIAYGTPASGGVASGTIAFSAERAEQDALETSVILVRPTASPDDLEGIRAAAGLLVARGGRTSHAAVVARQLGKVCVVNCRALVIDQGRHRCEIGGAEFREGDVISIDGDTGAVYRGTVEVKEERPDALIEAVKTWGGVKG